MNDQSLSYGTDEICFYTMISLICYDFVELVIKLIKLLLTNKYNWEEVYKSHKIMPTEMEEELFRNK